MGKVIEARDLTKKYGKLKAVDGITFDVRDGEIFSLVGPNGAGKTTIVEMLECLRRPTSGSAKVFGHDIVEERESIKKRIGVVPQSFNTFERLDVEENVKLILRIYGADQDVQEKLEELELWEEKDKKFGNLSGGMKRRVGIAMALAGDPDLLFLDEPTTGLDPQARRRLWETIEELRKVGVTIFLTTHYMEEVEELSDRASIIMGGRLLSTNSVDELISKYGGKIKIVVGDGGKPSEILEKFAVETRSDDEGNVIGLFESKRIAAEAQLELFKELSEDVSIDMVEPSIDDVFLGIMRGKIDEKGDLMA